MGTGAGGNFGNTKGSRTIHSASKKSTALASVVNLPEPIQKGVKSFFKGSSNNYTNYSITKNKERPFIRMENIIRLRRNNI